MTCGIHNETEDINLQMSTKSSKWTSRSVLETMILVVKSENEINFNSIKCVEALVPTSLSQVEKVEMMDKG